MKLCVAKLKKLWLVFNAEDSESLRKYFSLFWLGAYSLYVTSDKLYKILKMTPHASATYTTQQINLKTYNSILKKLFVQPNQCTMNLLKLINVNIT